MEKKDSRRSSGQRKYCPTAGAGVGGGLAVRRGEGRCRRAAARRRGEAAGGRAGRASPTVEDEEEREVRVAVYVESVHPAEQRRMGFRGLRRRATKEVHPGSWPPAHHSTLCSTAWLCIPVALRYRFESSLGGREEGEYSLRSCPLCPQRSAPGSERHTPPRSRQNTAQEKKIHEDGQDYGDRTPKKGVAKPARPRGRQKTGLTR